MLVDIRPEFAVRTAYLSAPLALNRHMLDRVALCGLSRRTRTECLEPILNFNNHIRIASRILVIV